MSQRFKDLYQTVQSPIPAAIELLRHIFVSPASILSAPLSKPVIQRLQWIPPSSDDVNESYLYFNNMIDQGASGPIHQLRLEMIHAGPSDWQVCKPEQVEYKVDENNIESDGLLCEILARVTVWKNEDSNNIFGDRLIDSRKKLGIILKLETEDLEPQEIGDFKREAHVETLRAEIHQTIFKHKKLAWKYFDLQDLINPGLDSRPWFSSLESASESKPSQTQLGDGSVSDDQKDYWVGYSSSSEDGSSLTSASNQGVGNGQAAIPIDPVLQQRIQKTPLYRSKAPSVSSTNSIQPPPQKVAAGDSRPAGPHDLLSRISRTPLYKRAPSIDDDDDEHDQTIATQTGNRTVLDHLLKAAEIVNLAESSSSELLNQMNKQPRYQQDTKSPRDREQIGKKSSACSIMKPDQPAFLQSSSALAHHSHIVPSNNKQNDNLTSKSENITPEELEENLSNSLRATFSFYKLSYNLLNHQNQHQALNSSDGTGPSGSDLSLGERFIALAHRAVLDQSSKNS